MQGKGTDLAEEEIAPGVTGHLPTERREVSKACHCVFTASYCSERRKTSSGGGGGREEGRREGMLSPHTLLPFLERTTELAGGPLAIRLPQGLNLWARVSCARNFEKSKLTQVSTLDICLE